MPLKLPKYVVPSLDESEIIVVSSAILDSELFSVADDVFCMVSLVAVVVTVLVNVVLVVLVVELDNCEVNSVDESVVIVVESLDISVADSAVVVSVVVMSVVVVLVVLRLHEVVSSMQSESTMSGARTSPQQNTILATRIPIAMPHSAYSASCVKSNLRFIVLLNC